MTEQNITYCREKPSEQMLDSKRTSNSRKKQNTILQNTQSGTVFINDSVVHFINPDLPFGGIGQSGTGRYHGRFSFETFSYKRPVMKKSNIIDINLRYPPYNKNKMWFIRLFVR